MTDSGQPGRSIFGPGQALQAGHVGTLAVIFKSHGADLFEYCSGLLDDPDEAVGATQATLIMASVLIRHLQDRGQLRPWALALARRECLSADPARAELADAGIPRSAGIAGEALLASTPPTVWQGSARMLLDPDLRSSRDAVVAHAGRLQPDGFPEITPSRTARSRLKLSGLIVTAVPAAAGVAIGLYFAHAPEPSTTSRGASPSSAERAPAAASSPTALPKPTRSPGLPIGSLFPAHRARAFLPVLPAPTPSSVRPTPKPKPSPSVRSSSPSGTFSPPAGSPSPSASPSVSPTPSPSPSPTPTPTTSGPATSSPAG
ncbi:MAG TPA: hypothetical protein VME44_11080 [Streptosporangiaceae bacterium]|nr:hypothetical protein [Streptosporangiaceae bacterium]